MVNSPGPSADTIEYQTGGLPEFEVMRETTAQLFAGVSWHDAARDERATKRFFKREVSPAEHVRRELAVALA